MRPSLVAKRGKPDIISLEVEPLEKLDGLSFCPANLKAIYQVKNARPTLPRLTIRRAV
jgi:hypothetical protein